MEYHRLKSQGNPEQLDQLRLKIQALKNTCPKKAGKCHKREKKMWKKGKCGKKQAKWERKCHKKQQKCNKEKECQGPQGFQSEFKIQSKRILSQPNKALSISFSVSNTGTESWTEGTYLTKFSKCHRLSLPQVIAVPPLAPGQSTDLAINVQSPDHGRHKLKWRLVLPNGQMFGSKLVFKVISFDPSRMERKFKAGRGGKHCGRRVERANSAHCKDWKEKKM